VSLPFSGCKDRMDQQKVVLAVGIGAALLSAAVAYKIYMKSNQMKYSSQLVKEWKACGVVSQLHIFPIKSCQGIPVEEAEAQKMGLVNGELQDRFVKSKFCETFVCFNVILILLVSMSGLF
jgi:hypothetical protein